MADIDIVPKRRARAWVWILLAIVIVVALWLAFGSGASRTAATRGDQGVVALGTAPGVSLAGPVA